MKVKQKNGPTHHRCGVDRNPCFGYDPVVRFRFDVGAGGPIVVETASPLNDF